MKGFCQPLLLLAYHQMKKKKFLQDKEYQSRKSSLLFQTLGREALGF